MKVFIIVLLSMIFLPIMASCSSAPNHPSLELKSLPPLIPIRDLFLNTDNEWGFVISPDGKNITWLGGSFWKRGIVMRFKNLETNKVVEFDGHNKREVGNYLWSGNSKNIIFSQDDNGNEDFGIFYVNINNPKKIINIAYKKNVRAYIHSVPNLKPNVLLYVSNARKKSVFDLYEYDFLSQTSTLVAKNPGDVIRWLSDENGKVRAVVTSTKDAEKSLYHYSNHKRDSEPVFSWGLEDHVEFLAFTEDRSSAWFHSNINRDKIGLVKIDLSSGQEQVIYASNKVDLSKTYISKVNYQPLHSLSYPDYPQNHFFNKKIESTLSSLKKNKQAIHLLSSDSVENQWVIQTESDKERKVYLLNKKENTLSLLAQDPVSKEHAQALASKQPFSFTSSDGLIINGYLTLPKGVPSKDLPTVLFVHGGPWHRDYWEPVSRVQFFANRGYAVLQVNYRGSVGYGRKYLQAAKKEFAGKMHSDLIEATQWAVQEGYSDPSKIAIYGRSYGGYATLVGLTFTPEVFQCGVDIVGPSNLVSLIESAPGYAKLGMKLWHDYAGDPNNPKDVEHMKSRSPLFFVDNITKPLLIFQGKHDSRVKEIESTQMVNALRKANKAVEYTLFENEGHKINHWKNVLTLHRKTEKFLHQCLGGRDRGFDYYEIGQWIPFF
jgi:dipeptidyl aminopeptidase/acylaminoacyl peptidase